MTKIAVEALVSWLVVSAAIVVFGILSGAWDILRVYIASAAFPQGSILLMKDANSCGSWLSAGKVVLAIHDNTDGMAKAAGLAEAGNGDFSANICLKQ